MNPDDFNKPLDHNVEDTGANSRELQMCTVSTDFPADATINMSNLLISQGNRCTTGQSSSLRSLTYSTEIQAQRSSLPFLFINRQTSYVIPPITSRPLRLASSRSPISVNLLPNQPQSLFVQAMLKLNENSVSVSVINQLLNMTFSPNQSLNIMTTGAKLPELTPPNSLTSAPPSYSFVLRQMAMRRRPRLMGTFIPSPSFVQHTPPPNYAAAFDIYVDNPMPPPPPRVYHFGFTPMPIVCPECGYTGLTMVTSKITLCTHLCAITLCIFCCWLCAPLPYLLKSCKDVYHYCRNCRNFLGMYCPTNPEHHTYSNQTSHVNVG